MTARTSGRVRLRLGKVEPPRTVDEHRRRGLAGEEPSRVDFADVGDEVGLRAARLRQDVGEAAEQLVVGKMSQRAFD
jgi:hypothetical protein